MCFQRTTGGIELFFAVIKRIINNKWMFLSMIIGIVLSTAMISSIPIYTEGIMQRVLIKDLENFQKDTGRYPGAFEVSLSLYAYKDESLGIKEYYEKIDNTMETQILNRVGLPYLSNVKKLRMDGLSTLTEEGKKESRVVVSVASSLDMESHIQITHGKNFSSKKEGDVYEVIATEEAMQRLGLVLNKVYEVAYLYDEDMKPFKIKLVGTFKNSNPQDSYWNKNLREYSSSVLMDFSLFKNEFLDSDKSELIVSEWYTAYDYHKLTIAKLPEVLANMKYNESWVKRNLVYQFEVPAIKILDQYDARQKSLKGTLIVLEMPIVLMLLFYLFMVSQLIIEQDKNEIAVLKSRGASRSYILMTYLIQGLLMCVAAIILGPPIGLLLCTIIGSSNGFMEFVQRAKLPVKLNITAYLYTLGACLAFLATMIIPAFSATKKTIVNLKQENSRKLKVPFWKKYFLDIILLAISLYGLYAYNSQQKILNITRANSSEIPIDPLLYGITTIFIISMGMVFLRAFPLIVKLIFTIGKERWKPAMYSSLLEVSRSGGKNQFIILFLTVTISTGLFSANSARTINTNIEEKEKYLTGADITIKTKWEDNRPPAMPTQSGPNMPSAPQLSPSEIVYKEPNFKPFTELSGVELATKVMRDSRARYLAIEQKEGSNNTYFMAVIPNEFAKVAWFRRDLTNAHWYEYLNILTKYPNGILISSSIAKENSVKIGQEVQVYLNSGDSFSGTVLGIIPYFPSYNPYSELENKQANNLIVANLSYIQQRLPLRPYEIWMKKQPNATSAQIYKDITEKKLSIESLEDASQNIIKQKNDPIVEGTNGSLTLGFIINLLVTMAGTIIFWIITIKSRTLQFGILRAMGLSLKKVIEMIVCELIVVSGSGIITGVIVGNLSSKLFVPLLQITRNSANNVPPFIVAGNTADYIKLYGVLVFMLITCFVVLGLIISKININQALKLGED